VIGLITMDRMVCAQRGPVQPCRIEHAPRRPVRIIAGLPAPMPRATPGAAPVDPPFAHRGTTRDRIARAGDRFRRLNQAPAVLILRGTKKAGAGPGIRSGHQLHAGTGGVLSAYASFALTGGWDCTVHVTVVRPDELGPREAEAWSRFQRASPVTANPFLSFSFTQAVGRARPAARVAVVEEGGAPAAFLPFELSSGNVGIPIGRPLNDLQGLLSSGAPLDAREIVKRAGLRGWYFHHAPAEQRPLVPHQYSNTTIQALVIDLEQGGYTKYLATRSKSLVRNTARLRRAMERQLGTVSLEWSSLRPEHLSRLVEWKSGKYSASRQLFAEDPTALAILRELATAGYPDCHGIVHVLSAGERPVVVYVDLLAFGSLTGWFTAYDPELSRFSPGTMMFFALAEEAANQGISRMDLGYGEHSYKFRLANHSYDVAGGAVWASSMENAVRRAYRWMYHDRRHDAKAARQKLP
jgi:CelD/BcsL family acetyltransferase involved in cellulose biosynthesis